MKPMNSGTAEHEQNGVTTPSAAASTLPLDSRRPASSRRVRAGEKYDRTMPDPKDDEQEEQEDLRGLVREELDRRGHAGAWRRTERTVGHPRGHGAASER